MELRYGINPHQRPASVVPVDGDQLPLQVRHGGASYINLLDALTGWQLVRDASTEFGVPAAASFKHVSPAGAALAGRIDATMAGVYGLDPDAVGPVTSAYVRARDTDPKSSYGDMVALSHPVDHELADFLMTVASDGIVAPGFEQGTVEKLSEKKRGSFLVLEVDASYRPPAQESRELFGVRFTQLADSEPLTAAQISEGRVCGELPETALADLLLGSIVLRYTQSNSVAYMRDGMTLGVGAGQQSRIDCTELAGAKSATWWLRRHPQAGAIKLRDGVPTQERVTAQLDYVNGLPIDGVEPLSAEQLAAWLAQRDGISMVSDGFIPFRDNVDHAATQGVRYIAEPGGSIRSGDVIAACQELGITLSQTGIRLFRH